MIVVNSSPLIALGKLGRLDLLMKCFSKTVVPKSVYDEVLLKKESAEAVALKKAVEEKWATVESSTISAILATKNIGQGEKEAISLAAKHKILLLIDDDTAKAYASTFGVEAHGTLYAIYLSCMKKIISKEEAGNFVKAMMEAGFYVSTEVYARFFELLNSLE